MAGRMSKYKGQRFERQAADILSLWFYGRKGILRRTPLSGGWSNIHAAGDIAIPTTDSLKLLFGGGEVVEFPFYVECKNRESWKFHHVFDLSSEILDWWTKALEAATVVCKFPMLILAKNYVSPFVIFCPPLHTHKHLAVRRLEFSNDWPGSPIMIRFDLFVQVFSKEDFNGVQASNQTGREEVVNDVQEG